jgi:hypothetical protein
MMLFGGTSIGSTRICIIARQGRSTSSRGAPPSHTLDGTGSLGRISGSKAEENHHQWEKLVGMDKVSSAFSLHCTPAGKFSKANSLKTLQSQLFKCEES